MVESSTFSSAIQMGKIYLGRLGHIHSKIPTRGLVGRVELASFGTIPGVYLVSGRTPSALLLTFGKDNLLLFEHSLPN